LLIPVSDGGGVHTATLAFLMVHVPGTDAVLARAVAAGATAEEDPTDLRRGNRWQIATSPA